MRLHTIASISSRDLVLGVSAERGVPEAVRASIAKLNRILPQGLRISGA